MIQGKLGQNREKKSTTFQRGKKSSPVGCPENKKSSAGWPGKKLIASSLPEGPPQIIKGPSLSLKELSHMSCIQPWLPILPIFGSLS